VDNPKNIHTVRTREVEHEHSFEARHSKDSKRCNTAGLKPTMPPHLRLRGEERKCLMGGEEKPVANLGARLAR